MTIQIKMDTDLYNTLDKWAEWFMINSGLKCDFWITNVGTNIWNFGFFFGKECCYEKYVIGQIKSHRGLAKLDRSLWREYQNNRFLLFQDSDDSEDGMDREC